MPGAVVYHYPALSGYNIASIGDIIAALGIIAAAEASRIVADLVELTPAIWDTELEGNAKLQLNELDGFGLSANLMFELTQPHSDHPEVLEQGERAWRPLRANVEGAIDAGLLNGDWWHRTYPSGSPMNVPIRQAVRKPWR